MSNNFQLLDVMCFCADWCGVCRALRPTFESLQINGCRLYWIDIEDHAEALDAIEIETFPSVVVANGSGTIYFAGVIEPHIAHFERLIKSIQLGLFSSANSPGKLTEGASSKEQWHSALQQLKSSGALKQG